MCRKRDRGDPVLVVELRTDEDDTAEARPAGVQGNVDAIGAVDLAGPQGLAALDDDQAAGRAGRLDLDVEDDAQQLFDVVRRGERFAEECDCILKPLALRLELAQPLTELLGHLVERLRQHRELVTAVHRDATRKVAAGDCIRRVHEPRHGANDRATLEPGDQADEDERGEQCSKQSAFGLRARRVDPSLRRQDSK